MDHHTKVPCPYNSSHLIALLKMPYHLHRCRKNHPNVDLAVCPYNATHEVRRPELKYHMANCPERTLLERDMAHNALKNVLLGKEDKASNTVKGNTDLPRRVRVECSPEDGLENWDEDESPPPVVTPQATGRTQYRKLNRGHQVNSHLRIPQTKSIAASLTSPDARAGTGSDFIGASGLNNHEPSMPNVSRVNNHESSMPNASMVNNHEPSMPNVSRVNNHEYSTPNVSRVNNHEPSMSNVSRLNNHETSMPNSPSRPFHTTNYLFSIGRGRARPSLQQPVTESRPLFNQPGLTSPMYIRMGRGGFKAKVKD